MLAYFDRFALMKVTIVNEARAYTAVGGAYAFREVFFWFNPDRWNHIRT